MIKINLNENDLNRLKKESTSKVNENSPSKEDEKKGIKELNLINKQNEDNSINIGLQNLKANTNKVSDKNIINKKDVKSTLNKAKTLNSERRCDRFGNKIFHGGSKK